MQYNLSLHVSSPLSDYHGIEFCVAELDTNQLKEIHDLILTRDYFNSSYYTEFYNYDSVLHKNGLLIVGGDLKENPISDEENRSSDIFVDYDWSADNKRIEVLNHVLEINNKGAFLISFRNESIYLFAEGNVSEQWNGEIQLLTNSVAIKGISDIGFYFTLLTDIVAEGVKWARGYSDNEEGDGKIYGTHQFLVVNGKVLMYARLNDEYPFDDYAPDTPFILDPDYENADRILVSLDVNSI